jgi:multidrug efflux system membrane fusion protein
VIDGLRVVREGLKAGDVIVVNGAQRVHPGVTVAPQRVTMGGEAAAAPAAAS